MQICSLGQGDSFLLLNERELARFAPPPRNLRFEGWGEVGVGLGGWGSLGVGVVTCKLQEPFRGPFLRSGTTILGRLFALAPAK